MGASFNVLVPEDDFSISYSTVNRLRAIMVSRLVGSQYVYNFGMDLCAYERIIKKLEEMMDADPSNEVIEGAYYFINHSDCDGDFHNSECEFISKAMFKMSRLMNEEGEEELSDMYYRLGELFAKAYNKGGLVVIW